MLDFQFQIFLCNSDGAWTVQILAISLQRISWSNEEIKSGVCVKITGGVNRTVSDSKVQFFSRQLSDF